MIEKLKAEVGLSETINLGDFNSKRFEFKYPFYIDDMPVDHAFKACQDGLDAKIKLEGYEKYI